MGDRLAGEGGVRQGEHRLQSGTTTPTPTLEPTPTPEPTPEPTPLPTLPPAEPIRALWMKSDALEAATAEAYLEEKLRQHYLAQASQPSVDFEEAPVIVFDGVRYVELLEPNTPCSPATPRNRA